MPTFSKITSILFICISLGVLGYFYLYNPSEHKAFFFICPTRLFFNLNCPICGGQRYLHQLLHLNIINAMRANLLVFTLFPYIVYRFIVALVKPFNINLPILHFSPKIVWTLTIFAFLFTVLRNIPSSPFNWLVLN